MEPVNESESAGAVAYLKFNATCHACEEATIAVGPHCEHDGSGLTTATYSTALSYEVAENITLGLDYALCVDYPGAGGYRFAGYVLYASPVCRPPQPIGEGGGSPSEGRSHQQRTPL